MKPRPRNEPDPADGRKIVLPVRHFSAVKIGSTWAVRDDRIGGLGVTVAGLNQDQARAWQRAMNGEK